MSCLGVQSRVSHGRGANGEDLLDLQRFWGRLVPEAEFTAPDAPLLSDMAPGGYQWVGTQDRSPDAMLAGVRDTSPSLDAFINDDL